MFDPASTIVKEVNSDASALGMSAEIKSRRCCAAQVLSGNGTSFILEIKLIINYKTSLLTN